MIRAAGGGRGGCPSGTQVCINIDNNTVTYQTDVPIKSFSTESRRLRRGFSGGVIGTLGFNVTSDNQSVSGTSTGRPIPVGSGVLLSFNGQVTKECLSSLSFIGENDEPLVANLHVDILAPTSQPTNQDNENKGGGRPSNGRPEDLLKAIRVLLWESNGSKQPSSGKKSVPSVGKI